MATLVIHFNAFTGKLEGGYVMHNGKKVGLYLTRAQVLEELAANPEIRCSPLLT